MKKLFILTALLALIAVQSVAAQSTLRRVYDDLEIDLWTNEDDGSAYTEGDLITVYFRASRDCYVTIYDLDTRGNINLIFPAEPDQFNRIEGDVVYAIPGAEDNYELTVEGPPGYEYLQMVATLEPHQVPEWWGPISVYDEEWPFAYDDDNDEFLADINENFFPAGTAALDQVVFYVAPQEYYQVVESDCFGDCGVVYIDYPVGCDVYIDGIYWGPAPLWIPRIYLGRHRLSVYWGPTIVYHDWITVWDYDPFFVYPYHHYLYGYYYHNWYSDWRWGQYYGPSQYKYKPAHYSYGKLPPRSGHKVVSNAHYKYAKSKVYTNAKTTRIEKYKKTSGYNTKTKTYTGARKAPTGVYGTKGKTYSSPSAKQGYGGKSKPGSGSTSKSGSVSGGKKGASPSAKSGSYDRKGKSSSGTKQKNSGVKSSKKSPEKSSVKSKGSKKSSSSKSDKSSVKSKGSKKSSSSKSDKSSVKSKSSRSKSSNKSYSAKKSRKSSSASKKASRSSSVKSSKSSSGSSKSSAGSSRKSGGSSKSSGGGSKTSGSRSKK